MREVTVALCSETWEKTTNKKYQKEVERLLELKGLGMVSQPRKYRRGGGVCIIADLSKVTIQPIEIPNPHNLEIVFALVKPKNPGVIKEIITFAFYSPPRSKRKSKMTDCIVTTLHSLLTSYPQAGIMGGGDRNCYNVSPVINAIPGLQNLQQLPTLGAKNLDILLSNMGRYYSEVTVVPPVNCDNPNRGVPSDHSVPIIFPLTNATISEPKTYTYKTTRPLPESGIQEFGKLILEENWESIKESESSDIQESMLQNILNDLMERSVPTKTVKLGRNDKTFMTKELKIIDRQRKREYTRNGKSQKYLDLSDKFCRKFKLAGKQFLQKNVDSIMAAKPGQAYKALKRMGAQPGDDAEDGGFELPEYVSQGLSAAECADRLAQAFANISQEFPPLDTKQLPSRTQSILKGEPNPFCDLDPGLPYISRQMVEEKIAQAKTTKGGVPGDLPPKLAKEFGPELARPAAQIFRTIAISGHWPKRWKMEQGVALKKVPEPKSEDELRIISLTPFLSKIFEKIVIEWLLAFISDKLDIHQYGGRKGTSINHYLIDFISFILYNQDQTEPMAILAAMIDFKKAFNRQNHAILITKLGDMGVPGWLLRIVVGFLEERELEVTYKGEKSGSKKLPGGGPQGTVLGMFLFLVLINDAGFAQEDRSLGDKLTTSAGIRKHIKNMHLKYVDDLTIAESLRLKNVLNVEKDKAWTRPLAYHDRTEQTLQPHYSQVQAQLDDLSKYAYTNQMKINHKKSKVMLFNTAITNDFSPEMKIDGVLLEVVEEMKLLGVIITNDQKWHKNTEHITKKAYARLWMLKRLKQMGASIPTLLDVYTKHVRSVLEFAAVVWNSSLTKENITTIERVQKCAFSVILGVRYNSYEEACKFLKMESLSKRRQTLSRKLAIKSLNIQFIDSVSIFTREKLELELRNQFVNQC